MRSGLAPVVLAVFAFAAGTAGVACGSSDAGAPPPKVEADAGPQAIDAAPDTAEAATKDYGSPSTTYPAFPVDAPTIVNQTGDPTLAAPVAVTITWPGDPLAATMEDFADKLGATSYWSAIASEYGIGAITSGPTTHVRIEEAAPATITPEEIANLVLAKATAAAGAGGGDAGADGGDAGASDAGGDGGGAWPAPTRNTVYVVYVHPSTKFTDQGTDICQQGVGGYHDNVFLGTTPIAYAVLPRCNFKDVDIEESAAHELIEAATDPFPSPIDQNTPPRVQYAGFDPDHWNWEVFNGLQDEVADACEFFASSYYQETGSFPYWVQRSWSNKAAKAGHDPCQPGTTEPYYNTMLFADSTPTITVDLTNYVLATVKTKGFATALNEPVTFPVGFFSDGPTSGPFTISGAVPDARDVALTDQNGTPYDNGTATVTIDKTSGVNGEKAYVTVTPTKAGASKFQTIVITASLPGAKAKHYLPVLIQNL